jgi:phage tail-like protein
VRVTEGGTTRLDVHDTSRPGTPAQAVDEAASVRDRFVPPAIVMDEQRRFQLPPSLRLACGRRLPDAVAQPELLTATPEAEERAVQRFAGPRGIYELDREQREARVLTGGGQLRSRFGPRDARGDLVEATDPQAWDPCDARFEGECAYLLDTNNQMVWRHRFGSESVEPAQGRAPWPCPAFQPSATPASSAWFDADGAPVPPPDLHTISNTRLYLTSGFWLSTPILSGIHRCQWDRIHLTLAPPPPGARIEVLTFAQDDPSAVLTEADDPRWDHAYTYVAPLEPQVGSPDEGMDVEFLVQSPPAENLLLQIRMFGDGYETAVIRALRLHYPRDSYVQFLPGVYSSQEEMRRFLERFLAAFQVMADQIEQTISTIARYFDPDAVPAGAPMRYLAGWLALTLEGTWDAEQNRKLLSAVPKILDRRGTPAALRDFIRVYLANAAGLSVEDVAATGFPFLLEGFSERSALMLNASCGPLWGPAAMARLQLGEFSRLGDVSLISTGDPDLDFFDRYAHRFKVFVPAAWVRTPDQRDLIRRATEAEKPAHTAYELVLVENAMRVDVQSTVGLDTILGDAPAWRLPCVSESPRLNVDTILGRADVGPTVGAGELLLS